MLQRLTVDVIGFAFLFPKAHVTQGIFYFLSGMMIAAGPKVLFGNMPTLASALEVKVMQLDIVY